MPAELVTKQTRQDMILEIIRDHDVHNQLELIKLLEERGVTATQSSVSRDIHELSIAKVDGRYMVAVLPAHKAPESAAQGSAKAAAFVTSLTPAGPNLLVVKTGPEGATAVGRSIERARWPEVLGVVASGDTAFVATPGKREQLRLITRLQEFMPRRHESDAPSPPEPALHDRPR